MKAKKLCSIAAFFVGFLLLSACSSPDTYSAAQEDIVSSTSFAVQDETDGVADAGTAQRWSADEFRRNEEDVIFFIPATDDYMLTEVYLLEQPDTGIVYSLTILRSFDKNGKVVSQIEKYSFDTPLDAQYCFNIFEGDGNNYPSLVCVGFSFMVEQTNDVVAEQRTKEQFISDYAADGTKHWLSMPVSSMEIAGVSAAEETASDEGGTPAKITDTKSNNDSLFLPVVIGGVVLVVGIIVAVIVIVRSEKKKKRDNLPRH